jgi:hypothetical protein
MQKQRFLLDASVFINGWRKHYPIDVFPSFWRSLSRLFEDGTAFSCWDVFEEIRRHDDELLAWVKERQHVFEKPTEDTIFEIQYLMHAFPNFAAIGGSTNAADPWVIAHARQGKATVVTCEEIADRIKPTKPPKMPNVCEMVGVEWKSPIEFLKLCNVVL